MLIRVATEHDVDALFDVRTSVVQNHQSRDELAVIGVTPDSVASMLRTTCRAWLAEVDRRPVAFSMGDAGQGCVFAMFVRPEYEGQGLGRSLMQLAENWLFSRGWEEIWLLTGSDPRLRAVGFYLHLGWRPAGGQGDGQSKYIKRKHPA